MMRRMMLRRANNVNAFRYYVRPVGQTYGTGDGTSYANAWSGANQVNYSLLEGNELAICGVHNQGFNIQASSVTIVGNDINENGVVNGLGVLSSCISVIDNYQNVIINDIELINATVAPIVVDGTSSGITNNVVISGSGNQGIQHYGFSNWTHNNMNSSNNADDGISGHDSATIVINGGTFQNNGEGIALVNSCNVTINNVVNISGNVRDITNGTNGLVTINNSTILNNVVARDGATTIINDSIISGIQAESPSSTVEFDVNNSIISGIIQPFSNDNSIFHFKKSLILTQPSSLGTIFFEDCYYKPSLTSSSNGNLRLNRCLIDGAGSSDHIFDYGSSKNPIIENSIFINIPNGRYGIVVRANQQSFKFNHNVLVGNNSNNGVFLSTPQSIQLEVNNCILYNLQNVANAIGFTFNNCNIFGNTNPILGTQNNTILGDPLFIDLIAKNYGLQATSPCIGQGATITVPNGVISAIWGNGIDETPEVENQERTTPFDIGAYIN